MKIYLIAFRGTGGFDSPKYMNEPALIKAGHVGIQFEGEQRVFGFHPNPQTSENMGGEDKVIELLRQHIAQPGTIQDDTEIFVRAYTLSVQGERTEVLALSYELSEERYQEIRVKLLLWYNEQTQFQYNFPQEGGGFPSGEYNCSTFPLLLGINIPTESGLLHEYVALMRQQGAESWQPK